MSQKNMIIMFLMFTSLSLRAQDQTDPTAETPVAEPAAEASAALATSGASLSSQVEGVDFKFQSDQSRLEVAVNGELNFEKNVSDADKQIIIDIKNTKISSKYARKLDTSSFKGNVSLISPYQNGNDVRVVLQLKEMGDVQVSTESGKIIALIDNKSGGAVNTASASATTTETTPTPSDTSNTTSTSQTSTPAAPTENTAQPAGQDGNLEEFTKASETKQYVGRKITLQLRDVMLKDVFRTISEASDFNIVIGDEVTGKISMNLVDVPWDQALDIILKSNKLAAERNGNVLRVTTLDNLTKEKSAEIAANVVKEAAEPMVVKIFPVSYASIDGLKTILDDFLSSTGKLVQGSSSDSTAPPSSALNALMGGSAASKAQPIAVSAGGGGTNARKGSIQTDKRTRSLIVRDTPTNLEKAKRIIKELDVQTPQILIEAKFVQVSEGKNKELSGRIYHTSRQFDGTNYSFKDKSVNWGSYFGGAPAGSALPTMFSITPTTGASFGLQPSAGLIPGVTDELAAFLSILESESHAKTISNPRIITQNNEQAEISQGSTIYLATSGGVGVAGSVTPVSATLKLSVTPQVTNDGAINLKVTFTEDSPGTAINNNLSTDSKKVDTNVLIDSGNTLVIGGIYTSSNIQQKAGIPILRDLPIIGILFGSSSSVISKSELFIFLTPRVVNEKEIGISG